MVTAKKLDIIIPVFNKEIFIEKLILELSKFPVDKCNIIFVDDGSIDSSFVIIKNTIENLKLHNFYYYTKINSGVSSTRNFGLEKARSEYIWFIDPDDFPHNESFNLLDKIFKYDEDILVFRYSIFNVKNGNFKDFIFDDYGKLETKDFLRKYDYFSQKNNMSFIWNKWYKRDFIANIVFDESVNLSEDRRFNLCIFSKNGIVNVIDKSIYTYFIYGENTLSSSTNIEKIKDVCETNYINLSILGYPHIQCKKHILVIFRALLQINRVNAFKFYFYEHAKLNLNIFPFYSLREFLFIVFSFFFLERIAFKAIVYIRKLIYQKDF